MTPETMVGELENRLLGLENLLGDPGSAPLATRGVKPVRTVAMFLSVLFRGPDFFSSGNGCNLPSTVAFCLKSLSLAFSAAKRALSVLNFISFHGLILTLNPCFLVKGEHLGSSSILIDNLV